MTTGRENFDRTSPDARRQKLERLMLQRDVDALFDREADSSARERVDHAMRADPRIAAEVEQTRAAIARLAAPIESPDFTARVMKGLEQERPFLDARGRRRVRAWRGAGVCAGLLLVTGVVWSFRVWPGWSSAPDDAPIAAVVDSAKADVASGMETLAKALESSAKVFEPARQLAAAPARPASRSADAGRLLTAPPLVLDSARTVRTSQPFVALSPSGGRSSAPFGAESSDGVDSVVRLTQPNGNAWRASTDLFKPRPSRIAVPFHPERGMAFSSIWDMDDDAAIFPAPRDGAEKEQANDTPR